MHLNKHSNVTIDSLKEMDYLLDNLTKNDMGFNPLIIDMFSWSEIKASGQLPEELTQELPSIDEFLNLFDIQLDFYRWRYKFIKKRDNDFSKIETKFINEDDKYQIITEPRIIYLIDFCKNTLEKFNADNNPEWIQEKQKVQSKIEDIIETMYIYFTMDDEDREEIFLRLSYNWDKVTYWHLANDWDRSTEVIESMDLENRELFANQIVKNCSPGFFTVGTGEGKEQTIRGAPQDYRVNLLAAFRILNKIRKIDIFFLTSQQLCINLRSKYLGSKAYVDDIAITLAQKMKNKAKVSQ
jgi:hypothetical protein